VVTATEGIVQCYCVALEFIAVTETVDIVQCFCVVCVVYCGYCNSRYSAMVLCCVGACCGYSNIRYNAMLLCCVWSLFWLQQQ